METIAFLVIVVFVLVWASRVEIGVNEIKKSVGRIEKQLNSKEKK